MKKDQKLARRSAVLGVIALALTGCSASDGSGSAPVQAPASATVTIEGAWVKAAGPGEMTAAFGTLANDGETDATVVAVDTEISPAVELHETVVNESGNPVMREIEGGFVIPAHDHLHLEPGGNHIMLMDLPSAVLAGESVAMTLEFSDGSELEFTAVVKDYAGANENYEDGGENEPHDGKSNSDHGGHEHHGGPVGQASRGTE